MSIRSLLKRLRSDRNELASRESECITACPAPVTGDFPLRESQEDKLYKALCQRGRQILLYGPGGMGKTHMARKLFYRMRGEYKRMAWVSYGAGIRESMTMPQMENASDNPDVRFVEFIQALEEEPDTILFIDDAKENAVDDLVLAQLTGLGITILLTSRCENIPPYESWRLETVTDQECADLFYAHYTKDSKQKYRSYVENLANQMGRNIFAMRLLAAVTGEPDGLTRMDEVLKEGDLMDYIGHLMESSELTDSQREVIRCLSLMPSSEMPEELVDWFGFPKADIEALVEKGWLIRSRKTEGQKREAESLILHDLVREYSNQKDPGVCTLEIFLKGALGDDFCKSTETDYSPNFKGKILELQVRAITLMEKFWSEPKDLAQAYNSLGIEFRKFGSYRRALEYLKMGLELREKLLPVDDLALAISYNSVGSVYGDLGDHEKELEYLLRSLDIREKVLTGDNPDLATSYNNLGLTYGDLGDSNKELEYLLKAKSIREKALSMDDPDMATTYNNLGTAYEALGDNEKARDYLLKAIAILEKVQSESQVLATLYNNIGVIYGKTGNSEEQMHYCYRAFKLQEKILPEYHPDIALSCHNIAKAYLDKKQYETALSWETKACRIANQSLTPEHPYRKKYEETVESIEQKIKE